MICLRPPGAGLSESPVINAGEKILRLPGVPLSNVGNVLKLQVVVHEN